MINADGALGFSATIDDSDFNKKLDAMVSRLNGIANPVIQQTQQIDSSLRSLGNLAKGYFAFDILKGLPDQLIRVRGEFQQLEITFTTMLKSKAKSDALIQQIVQAAAETPFSLREVSQGAKQLLAFGGSASTVIDELKMLGDVASGVSAPIGDLIYLYGTLRTQGRAFTVDIRQFASRGIPIYEELAKVLGISTQEVGNFVEAGKVGFKEVEQVFKNLTSQGGTFENLMTKQSSSLVGLKARLMDAFEVATNEIGKANEGILASGLTTATGLVENYKPFLDTLTVIVATYGTYKAAVMALNVAQSASNLGSLISGYINLGNTLGPLTAQQIAFNNAVKLNPYALAASAIIALVTAIAFYSNSLEPAKRIQEEMNQLQKEDAEYKNQLTTKTQQLSAIIRDSTATQFQQVKAFKDLQAIYPDLLGNMSLQEFQALSASDAQKQFNQAIDSFSAKKLQDELKKAQSEIVSFESKLKTLNDARSKDPLGGTAYTVQIESAQKSLDVAKGKAEALQKQIEANARAEWEANTPVAEKVKYYEQNLEALKKQRDEMTQSVSKLGEIGSAARGLKGILQELTIQSLNEEIDDVSVKLQNLTATPKTDKTGGNKAFWEKVKKDAEEARNALGVNEKGSKDWNRYTKEIENANKKLEAYSTTVKKAKTDKFAITAPVGTLEYWEQVSKRASEILSKTDPNNLAKVSQQIKVRDNAEAKANKIRAEFETKTFDQVLEEKKKAYENYQQFAYAIDKQTADEQFKSLLQSGKTFEDYLNSRIDTLKQKGSLSPDEQKQLSALVTQLDNVQLKKNPLQNFEEGLARAKEASINLVDYLETLKSKQIELNQTGGGLIGTDLIAAKQKVQEEINSSNTQLQKQLQDFNSSVEGSEQKRYAIIKKYEDLITQARKNANEDFSRESYEKNLENIEKAKRAELDAWETEKAQATNAYKNIIDIVDNGSKETLRLRIEAIDKYLEYLKASFGTESAVYKEWLKVREKLLADLKKSNTETALASLAIVASETGNAFTQLGGAFAVFGKALSIAGSTYERFAKVIQKDKNTGKLSITEGFTGEAVSTIANVGISLFSSMLQAQNDVATKNREIVRQTINQQIEYNKLLNDAIGLQYKYQTSALLGNTAAEIGSKFAQLKDATNQYGDSIKKLTGTSQNINKLLTVGAPGAKSKSIWDSLGSLISPIGLIKEAVDAFSDGVLKEVPNALIKVGTVTTGFLGTSTKDVFDNLLKVYPKLIDDSNAQYKAKILALQKAGYNINPEILKKVSQAGFDMVKVDVALAKSLISSGKLEENTKTWLQNTVDWYEKLEEINKQIDDIVSNLAGGLSSDLRNALVEAFEAGTSAAEAFASSVEKTLENITSQLIFEAVFGEAFKTLSEDIKASFKGGDGSVIDDFSKFFNQYVGLSKEFDKALQEAQKEAEKAGLKIFKPTTGGTTSTNEQGLAGAIKGVTEETASIIAGQITTMRIYQAEGLQVARQSLASLNMIVSNTAHLISIDNKLSYLQQDPLRAKGLG
ncbi:tape measure protein [Flectobacillus sp. DC10W]|uniref:Tape measure protein n=1 Tax=Flectobacillus longus TaxID=2984207 RepID=A0ABT6YK64_9BACT|nr:tape measure protein [Flectobacillus longus]MDI9863955.1 tape measure protein [Flectobacillus longus]